MKIVSHCPSCLGNNIQKHPARFDAWMINRMTGGLHTDQPSPQMIVCDCGFAGVDWRFSPEENTRYYKDYMTPNGEYVNSRGIQNLANYFHSKEYINMRKDTCEHFIEPYLDFSTIASVLDYGGDTGHMIPTALAHAQRYVYDVEARTLAPGVQPYANSPVDLLLNSHTLEHVSDIHEYMRSIIACVRPGGYIYTEVPLESAQHFGPGYEFHEHINLWTERSLVGLHRSFGIEIHAVGGLMYRTPMCPSIAIFGKTPT